MFKQFFSTRITLVILLSALCALFVFLPSQAQSEDSSTVNDKIEKLSKNIDDLESVVKALSSEIQKMGFSARGDDTWYPRILATEALSKDLFTDLKHTNIRLSQLESAQKKLSKLPVDLKSSVASLANRTKTNEQTLSQLQDSLSKITQSQNQSMFLQNSVSLLEQRLALLESTNANAQFKAQADQFYKALQEQTDKRYNSFQSGIKASFKTLQDQNEKSYKNLQTQFKSYQEDFALRLNTVDTQIKQLQDSVAALALRQEKGESTVLETRTFISEFNTRTEQVESRVSKLQDVVTQIYGLQPIVASLQDQIYRLDAKVEQQLSGGQSLNVLQSQYNTVQTQVADLRERIAALQNKIETLSSATSQGTVPEKRLERLQEAIGQVLIETQANKIQINQLEAKVNTMTATGLTSSQPSATLTTLSDDLEQRLKQAEQIAKDAKASVELANTISLIALLAGIAGIVVGLIL